jgi:hypothetical protein
MSRLKKILIAFAVLGVLIGAGLIVLKRMRGDTGATSELGGGLEATVIPEFSSSEPGRWVNGAPMSLEKLRGSVVLIEAWHPT